MSRVSRTLGALILLGAVLALAGPARAGALDVTCAGTLTANYSPGLTLAPAEQTIATSRIYAPCVSTTVPGLTAGLNDSTQHMVQSCLDALQSRTGSRTISWNDGTTSTINYNATVSHVGANTVVTFTGQVIDGRFEGDTYLETVVGPTPNILACFSDGVKSRSGIVTLEITSI